MPQTTWPNDYNSYYSAERRVRTCPAQEPINTGREKVPRRLVPPHSSQSRVHQKIQVPPYIWGRLKDAQILCKYLNIWTRKTFSVMLMCVCAVEHLLDCEWFIPGNLCCQKRPFWHTILPLLHSHPAQKCPGDESGSHPWLRAVPSLSPPHPQPELISTAAFSWHLVPPVQVLNCPSRCTRTPLSSHVLSSLKVGQLPKFLFAIQPSLSELGWLAHLC